MNGGAVLKARLEPRSAQPLQTIPCSSRAARLLALAHSIDARVTSGEFDDLAAAARTLGLTRARVTQLVNLTLLSPAIQEEILEAGHTDERDPISEHALRQVVAETDWSEQQRLWSRRRREDTECPT